MNRKETKLLVENWRRLLSESILIESVDSTSWGDGECVDKITLREVLDYFEDNSILPKEFSTQKLFYKLSKGKEVLDIIKNGGEKSESRVKAASLEYPVIVVMRDSDIKYVLDGNHRLQKAKDLGKEFIKVSVLDLDDPRIPEAFVSMF